MLMSFTFSRPIRPIYRACGRTSSRSTGGSAKLLRHPVVRAFGREILELLDYMRGRHTVLRKELFAHRRELVSWTSWGLLQAGVNVVIVWFGGYLNVLAGPRSATSWRFNGTPSCCWTRCGTS
jgi:ATP-binding cassette subfamily B protein/subfamily B ATP-binding cassette protein MsbA